MANLAVSSSSLLALNQLVPPSPELLPDTSLTSGHIPILLDGLSLHDDDSEHAFLHDDDNSISDIFLGSVSHVLDSISRHPQAAITRSPSPSPIFDYDDSHTVPPTPPPFSHHFNLSPTLERLRRSLSPSKMLTSASFGKLVLPSRSRENSFVASSDTLSTLDACVFPQPSWPATPDSTPPPTPSKRRPLFSTAIRNALMKRSGSTTSLRTITPSATPAVPSFDHHSKGHRRGISEQLASTMRVPSLPDSLSFLRDIVIEAHIDQESFRSVVLGFKLAGYSPLSRSIDPSASEIPVAEFMPVTRQAFHFHYAPFEAAPVLRRLTVVGRHSWDHLTREAAMSLKGNGIYTIRGTESCDIPSGTGVNGEKLRWKLEYMVTDRRNGGKVLDGEKTLTPLLFACSPLLLYPMQGKKIRLVHIMKKSITPSLIAEKMQPPVFEIGPLAQSTPAHPRFHDKASHRRAQSQAGPTKPVMVSPNHSAPRRHRRTVSSVNADEEACYTSIPATCEPSQVYLQSPPSPCDKVTVLKANNPRNGANLHGPEPPYFRVSLPRSDGRCYISRELTRKAQ